LILKSWLAGDDRRRVQPICRRLAAFQCARQGVCFRAGTHLRG
jgi:hypothetical protein